MSDNTSSIPAAGPLAAFSDAVAAIVEAVGASTLSTPGHQRRGLASAVVWKPGVVVTAAHVFRRNPAAISLLAGGGNSVEATLAGIDSPTDIAVFRVPEQAAPAAHLGDPSTLKAGSLAIAVGRSASGDLTASYGIVNRTSGAWETWLGGQLDRMIRLDGSLYQGLSGGPVADASGKVVGIATSALSRSYGMVVPATTVTRVVEALLSKGHVPRAFLGIGAQPVPVRSQEDGGADAAGLLITGLVAGGPADSAGMLVGDILIGVDGKAAASLHDLRAGLADKVGQAVQATVHRGGVPTELKLEVGQWPTEKRRC
jgi:serine protease Do